MRALAVLCIVLLAGCATPTPDLLSGSTWTLDRLVASDGTVQRGAGERVTFGAGGALSLVSCNSCGGTYRLREGVLTVAPALTCTLRACEAGTVELERYLTAPLRVRRDGAYLVLDPVDPASPVPQLVLAPEAVAP